MPRILVASVGLWIRTDTKATRKRDLDKVKMHLTDQAVAKSK